jgi:shikimate dehydrogenase
VTLRTSGKTRVAGVMGWPVEHSRSPALHNAAYAATSYDAVYLPLRVPPGGLADALRGATAMGFLGVNVTVPHKQAAVSLCHELDPVAERAGAVNTIVIRDGRRVGHNTDVPGLADSLNEASPPLLAVGGRATVLGSGGAARAAVMSLIGLGFECAVVARSRDRAEPLLGVGAAEIHPWTTDAMRALFPDMRLVVDATSAGLDPATERALPAPVPLDALAREAMVCSLVYHRLPALLAEARALGVRTLDGSGMLIHQAARAFTLMTGIAAPLEAMRAAF